MSDFFSLDDDNPVSDGEESGSLHRNCLKELALEQLQDSDYSDAASDISEDLPEGTDWSSLPVAHRKHDRNVDEEPPMVTPREYEDRPRSARTAAGVRFAAAEHIFQGNPVDKLDSARPRTAASRGAGAELKEAKKFTFSAEGHMSDWHTTQVHATDGATSAPDAFPTPTFVRKAIEARRRPHAAVPPLNLSSINSRPHDAPVPRHAVSSSARSSSFTPRNTERSRQRQREHDGNGRDFLDSYRQDLVAVFMGSGARRVVKAPLKKRGTKKKSQSLQSADVEPLADAGASEPSLGSTLRATDGDAHPYTASPVPAAAAEPSSFLESSIDEAISDAHTAAQPSPLPQPQPDSARLRASTANIIEQAALSGIEDLDAVPDAEQRISAIVKRSQVSSSPGKRGGHGVVEDAALKAAVPSSQKAHMLPYLQSGRRPKLTPRAGGGDFGEVDWQVLYNESEGRVLTNLMAFELNGGGDASNQGAVLCTLLHVPKAFTGQVMRAAASAHGLITLDNCRQLLCSAFQKLLEREALLQHIHIKQGLGAPTYADIVNLGRLSAVVAVKLKELRRSMFWIGQSRCFVWGKQDYEKKMAHDMEEVQLRF